MPPAYELLLLNTAIPQIQAAQSGDTYLVPRDIAINATAIISANSATDALRITQTGAGNALLVEDSANPDSTPFVVTATGDVGIGTSSPAVKLQVNGSGQILRVTDGTTGASIYSGSGLFGFNNQTGEDGMFGSTSSHYLYFATNGAEKMRLDSSGNLGLGVTPSAWTTSFGIKAFDISGGSVYAASTDVNLVLNAYFNSNFNWVYKTTNPASLYQCSSGSHTWYTAPSGTADGTAATALTSAQNGNSYTIKVAGTTDFTLIGAANNNVGTVFTKSGGTGAGTGTVSQNISFTQAMTLDASGNLVIGRTSGNLSGGSAGSQILTVSASAAGRNGILELNGTRSTSGDYVGYVRFFNNAAATPGADIQAIRGASDTEGTLAFATSGTERARITSGGYFKASNTGNYNNVADTYHEFNQSANNIGLFVGSTNASLANEVLWLAASRNTTNNSFYAISYYNSGAAAYKFKVADSGDVTNTNGTYGTISDAKMKTDIVDAGSQWSDIKALRFRKFKMKNDPSGLVQLGVVAQEVEQTSPGLVDEHADKDAEGNDLGTTTKSVKTSVLLMKAAVALQEAMARIEKLEAEVAALKGA